MSSYLPDGFKLRTPSIEDAEAAAAVAAAEEAASRGGAQWDGDDQREWWALLDLGRNAWLVERDARVVASASLLQRADKLDGWVSVHPDFTGHGLGTALVQVTEARARELGGPALRLHAYAENADGRRLLERLGFRDVRRFYDMRIDLGADAPPEPVWPRGLSVAPFHLGDARALHTAINDAFADEWNFHPRTFEEFVAHRLEVPGFDATLWFVVKDRDEIAGFVCAYAKQFGGPWIALVGVRKPWRKRGLGLALLQQSFREFHRRGVTRVGLGVDADNPTGATRLYERAGMYVHAEDITYEKVLS